MSDTRSISSMSSPSFHEEEVDLSQARPSHPYSQRDQQVFSEEAAAFQSGSAPTAHDEPVRSGEHYVDPDGFEETPPVYGEHGSVPLDPLHVAVRDNRIVPHPGIHDPTQQGMDLQGREFGTHSPAPSSIISTSAPTARAETPPVGREPVQASAHPTPREAPPSYFDAVGAEMAARRAAAAPRVPAAAAGHGSSPDAVAAARTSAARASAGSAGTARTGVRNAAPEQRVGLHEPNPSAAAAAARAAMNVPRGGRFGGR
ncbi:hypothetical protein [Rhizosaccharibacter radicis]|uniref:Uncharacterized protein n=1 Tax=Rhizosaccharibacter radicis TaxID=2782605 RepID=A0ABT1VWU2_9PROT|nr:hypothetical protein [Acetobacteraceae bacterium KSS12]